MKHTHLIVDYADPLDPNDVISVDFRLRDYPIVSRWVERVKLAIEKYPIDDPVRFYGFESLPTATQTALARINQNIKTINQHQPLIQRTLTDINDQDTLNYLHNIFERFHGLLDHQDTTFWTAAPTSVKLALADLNVCVHRCESISRGNRPRQVTTWYGLPKTQKLLDSDYQHFTSVYCTGTVYLNYVEIGKTFEDLTNDNDQYISDDAFRPYQHYSADFNVKFYNTGEKEFAEKAEKMLQYYIKNQKFFNQKGLTFDHPYMRPGSVPLADADVDLAAISTHLYVKKVSFK